MVFILLFLSIFLTADAQLSNNDKSCQTPDSQPGICTLLANCTTMLDFLAKDLGTTHREKQWKTDKLNAYGCGVSSTNRKKVCCPWSPIPTRELDEIINHQNIELLPLFCGNLYTFANVTNKDVIGIFEFPWLALLSYKTKNGTDFLCGGTIINENYILTAAHCVKDVKIGEDPAELIGVRIGDHNLEEEIDCEEEDGDKICASAYKNLTIEETIYHKNYSETLHDIALIRVTPPIDIFHQNTRPVCLPTGRILNYHRVSNDVVLTGWGATETKQNKPIPKKVHLPIVPRKKCQKAYHQISDVEILPTHVCAGGKNGLDTCPGDSGGPLHALVKFYGELLYVQEGIVSFGVEKCREFEIPGVYTRVVSYMKWILDNIKP